VRAAIRNSQSEIRNPQFAIKAVIISPSELPEKTRLHSLPLVVIFPVAFEESSAADLQYPAGVTFGRYGGV
jgi:hypothetical protein